MSVVMMIDNPNGSQEIYEKVAAGLTLPIGGQVHLAGPRPGGGWRVIEVWASEEEARRFLREAFGPAPSCGCARPISTTRRCRRTEIG